MMQWSREQQIFYLQRLPWTIIPEPGDDPGDFVLTIAEVPAAIGTGTSEKAVIADLFESLASALASYLDANERPPLPRRVRLPLPWEAGYRKSSQRRVRIVMSAHSSEIEEEPINDVLTPFEVTSGPQDWVPAN